MLKGYITKIRSKTITGNYCIELKVEKLKYKRKFSSFNRQLLDIYSVIVCIFAEDIKTNFYIL